MPVVFNYNHAIYKWKFSGVSETTSHLGGRKCQRVLPRAIALWQKLNNCSTEKWVQEVPWGMGGVLGGLGWGRLLKEAAHEGTTLVHSPMMAPEWLLSRLLGSAVGLPPVGFLTVQFSHPPPHSWTKRKPTVDLSQTAPSQPPASPRSLWGFPPQDQPNPWGTLSQEEDNRDNICMALYSLQIISTMLLWRSCRHSFQRTYMGSLRRGTPRAFCFLNCNSICDTLGCLPVTGGTLG